MNFGFNFRDALMSLSPTLVAELDQLIAAIQAGWNVQHKQDGTHGDVTAPSVRSTRFGAMGIYVKELPYDQRTGSQGNNTPFFDGISIPDGVSIIMFKAGSFPVTSPVITRFEVVSLRPTTPPKTGDMIWVGGHRDTPCPIDLLCGGSQIDLQYGFQKSTKAATNIGNTFTLSDSAFGAILLTPLIYLGPDINGIEYGGANARGPLGCWSIPQLVSP